MTAIRFVLLRGASGVLATGCGSDDDSGSSLISAACASAFDAAATVDEMHDTNSDMFPAFSACSSVDEWNAADKRWPEALDGVDPVLYARTACDVNEELSTSAMCAAVRIPEQGLSLTLDEVRVAAPGDVTGDLLRHPDSAQARFVDAVMDEAGLYAPSYYTDKNLIVYGLDTCDDANAPRPVDWDPPPLSSEADVERFADVARRHAQQVLC